MNCGYKIGKLKNYIYLVENLVYKVVDYKVYIVSGKVYKLNASLVTFNETESFNGRFKFTTTVNCTLNRMFDDLLLRQNEFKVVVEDLNGMLFLVSPEFNAAYTSELNITNDVNYLLILTTQSNIPTRIIKSKITPTQIEGDKICSYDDIGKYKLFIGRDNKYSEVKYLTSSYKKVFNGRYDDTQVVFTIPIEDNDWHYDLIKFPKNRWDIKIVTTKDTIYAYSLFPQFTRQTSEESLDKFTITLNGLSGGTLQGDTSQLGQYRWVPTEDFICSGFNKYVKEEKLLLIDDVWVSLEQYRKGVLVEKNSEFCGYTPNILYRWVNLPLDLYICVNFNKHYQQKELKSVDEGRTWEDTGKFRNGDLIEANSKDCGYVLIEWKPIEGEYFCDEYDPSVTWVLLSDEFYCTLKNI